MDELLLGDRSEAIPEHKPTEGYFRRALIAAETRADAIGVGLHAIREMEHMRQYAEEAGFEIPPRFIWSTEADDKGPKSQKAM